MIHKDSNKFVNHYITKQQFLEVVFIALKDMFDAKIYLEGDIFQVIFSRSSHFSLKVC